MAAALAALAITAASAAYNAYQQHKAGQAAKGVQDANARAAMSEADLSDYNASVADLQAQDATARGTQAENKFRVGVRGLIASQRAGFAGNNVDVGYGSAVDVTADAARLGELDALTIRTNAAREAWGYKVQATDLRKRAQIQREEGANYTAAGNVAASTGNAAAIGTVLGTGASLLQAKYGFKSQD